MARADNLEEYYKTHKIWNKTPDFKFNCKKCYKEVIITEAMARANPKKRFCSKDCFYNFRRKRVSCEVCNKEITIPKSRSGKNISCSKKCFSKFKSRQAKELGYGKWMKGRDMLKHISMDGRKRISISSRKNFENSLGKYISENDPWNKGIPHTREHKQKLKEAKKKERLHGRPWLRDGSYYPCCTCYKKLIYLNYSWMVRAQKPYCSRDCSPLKKHTCSDEVILDALMNKKMTMKEIYSKHHCNPIAIKKILKRNGISYDIRTRQREILSELRKKDFKDGKFIFPLKDSSIEVKIHDFLFELGIKFLKHKYIEINHGYQCDIFIPCMNLVIEADGDYWHKYPDGREIDKVRTSEMIQQNFNVLRLWEHEIKKMDIDIFKDKLKKIKLGKSLIWKI